MVVKKMVRTIQSLYFGSHQLFKLFSDDISDWMKQLEIEFVKVDKGHYMVVPIQDGIGQFRELLCDIRIDYELSQREIGDFVRKSPSTISNYEYGKVPFHHSMLDKLCECLQVSIQVDESALKKHFNKRSFAQNFPSYDVQMSERKNNKIVGTLYSSKQKTTLLSTIRETGVQATWLSECDVDVLVLSDTGEFIKTDDFYRVFNEEDFHHLHYLCTHFDELTKTEDVV